MILHFRFTTPVETSLHFRTQARKNGLFVSIWHKPYGSLDRFYWFDRFSWFSFSFNRLEYTVTCVVNRARSLVAWRDSNSWVHCLNCCWFWGRCQATKTTEHWSLCFILGRNKNILMFNSLFHSGEARWCNGLHAGIRIARSGFESRPGTLHCLPWQDTSLSQLLSPPRCITGYRRT